MWNWINNLSTETAGVYAILICLTSSIAAKLYMSMVWRSQQLGGGKEAVEVEQTKGYRFDSRAQLNEVIRLLLTHSLTHSLTYYSQTY